MTNHLEKMFSEYEDVFNSLDIEGSARFFADTFISAGPNGTISISKSDFVTEAQKTSDFYRSVGQTSAKIISKKYFPYSDNYTMVTVHWGATFRKLGNSPIEFDVSYLVHHTGNTAVIILFIAHPHDEEAMKKLSLI